MGLTSDGERLSQARYLTFELFETVSLRLLLSEEEVGVDVEGSRDPARRFGANAALATLDPVHRGSVEASKVSELLLRQALLFAERADDVTRRHVT